MLTVAYRPTLSLGRYGSSHALVVLLPCAPIPHHTTIGSHQPLPFCSSLIRMLALYPGLPFRSCVLYPLELKYRSWERYEGPHKAFVQQQEHAATRFDADVHA